MIKLDTFEKAHLVLSSRQNTFIKLINFLSKIKQDFGKFFQLTIKSTKVQQAESISNLSIFLQKIFMQVPGLISFHKEKLQSIKSSSIQEINELLQSISKVHQNYQRSLSITRRTQSLVESESAELKQLVDEYQNDDPLVAFNMQLKGTMYSKIKQTLTRTEKLIKRFEKQSVEANLSTKSFQAEYQKYKNAFNSKLKTLSQTVLVVLCRVGKIFKSYFLIIQDNAHQYQFLQEIRGQGRPDEAMKHLILRAKAIIPKMGSQDHTKQLQFIFSEIRKKYEAMTQGQLNQFKSLTEIIKVLMSQSLALETSVEKKLGKFNMNQFSLHFGDKFGRLCSQLNKFISNLVKAFVAIHKNFNFYLESIQKFADNYQRNRQKPILIRNFSRESSLQKDIERIQSQVRRCQQTYTQNKDLLINWVRSIIKNYSQEIKAFVQSLEWKQEDAEEQVQEIGYEFKVQIAKISIKQEIIDIIKKARSIQAPDITKSPRETAAVFSCGLNGKLVLQGKLIIDEEDIYFQSNFNKSNIFFGGTFLTIHRNQVQTIERTSGGIIMQNGIDLVTTNGTLSFVFLFNIQDAHSELSEFLDRKQQYQAKLPKSIKKIQLFTPEQKKMIQARALANKKQIPSGKAFAGCSKKLKGATLKDFYQFFCLRKIEDSQSDPIRQMYKKCQANNLKVQQISPSPPNFEQMVVKGPLFLSKQVEFDIKINIPFFPSNGHTTQKHKIFVVDDKRMIISMINKTAGLPMSQNFQIQIVLQAFETQENGEAVLNIKSSGGIKFYVAGYLNGVIEQDCKKRVKINTGHTVDTIVAFLKKTVSSKKNQGTGLMQRVQPQTEQLKIEDTDNPNKLMEENEQLRKKLRLSWIIFVFVQIFVIYVL